MIFELVCSGYVSGLRKTFLEKKDPPGYLRWIFSSLS